MSRVGKMPVAVPQGVDVQIKDDQISVKGTGGTLSLTQNALVKVANKDGKLNKIELAAFLKDMQVHRPPPLAGGPRPGGPPPEDCGRPLRT